MRCWWGSHRLWFCQKRPPHRLFTRNVGLGLLFCQPLDQPGGGAQAGILFPSSPVAAKPMTAAPSREDLDESPHFLIDEMLD